MCRTPSLKELLHQLEGSLAKMKLSQPADLKNYLNPARIANMFEMYQLLRMQHNQPRKKKVMIFVSETKDADELAVLINDKGLGPAGAAHYKLGGNRGNNITAHVTCRGWHGCN